MINTIGLPAFVSASALALALSLPAVAQESDSQESQTEESREQSESEGNIEEIVVTGSLIPRSANNLESFSPITVVSEEEMAERGYLSIGDVMSNATQNSGYTEGTASNLLGSFTTGGQTVNLRGLGSGRTLVLVNGRRIADYPLPFGGDQNGADIGTIPMAAVASMELLASGASAIYGSDAVGGVVNYITKRDMEQTTLNVHAGGYQQGFGEYLQGSFVTGQAFDRGSFTFGIEAYHTGEVLLSNVDYFAKKPFEVGMVQMLRRDGATGGVIGAEPTNGACEELGFEDRGDHCAGDLNNSNTIVPEVNQVSSFFDSRYQLTDEIELFATVLASGNEYLSKGGELYWAGTVVSDDGSEYSSVTRRFSEQELGLTEIIDNQKMWTGVVGANGGLDLGYDTWQWDVSFSRGEFRTKNRYASLKEEGVKNWLLNGADNISDYPGQDYTYLVDSAFYHDQLAANVFRNVQPADRDSLVGYNTTDAFSSSDSLTFTLNGALSDFDVLAKPVKFAVRSEIARQSTEITPDQRALDDSGNGWYQIGNFASKGTRHRKALSAEVEVPVLDNLDVSIAGRFDHYSDASAVTGRPSTQVKFIYRPTDWLKVRGGYSQTFRAPDMYNIYGHSESFVTAPDLAAPGCFDGEVYYCNYAVVNQDFIADKSLVEETGDDYSLGLIWTPVVDFNLTLDWYKVELRDLVLRESASDVMFKAWQCDNGLLNGSERLCEDVHSRIIRDEFGQLESINVKPINQDSLETTGLDLRAAYIYESEDFGIFSANLSHTKILDYTLLRFEGDEAIDYTHGVPGSSLANVSTNLSLGWYNPLTTGKAVASTVNIFRRGGVRNYLGTQEMAPMYDVNLTASYQFSHNAQASLIVQNLFNTMPADNGSGQWPGFWMHLQGQAALGRAIYLNIGYQFN